MKIVHLLHRVLLLLTVAVALLGGWGSGLARLGWPMAGRTVCRASVYGNLLGFVFSRMFGHAPIILPAVTGLRLNYTPLFYGYLILPHTTLVYRMYGNLVPDFTPTVQRMVERRRGAVISCDDNIYYFPLKCESGSGNRDASPVKEEYHHWKYRNHPQPISAGVQWHSPPNMEVGVLSLSRSC